MDLLKDKYIIVEVIPTRSTKKDGFIAQISALKLDGIKLLDRFDYRVKDDLIENEDLRNLISYDKEMFTYVDNIYFIIEKFKRWVEDYPILIFENGIKVLLDKFSLKSFVLFLYIILFTVWIGILL